MPTKNTKRSMSVISLLFGRPMQPTPPLYWRSRRKLPTGLSAANQPREAHVPPRRFPAQGPFGTLSGWPVYYGLPHWAATPKGYRALGTLSGWPVYYGLPHWAATPKGYRGYPVSAKISALFFVHRNLFRINTYTTDTKQTTLSPFRISTYEKPRGSA